MEPRLATTSGSGGVWVVPLVGGFGTAVAMWCVGLLMAMPCAGVLTPSRGGALVLLAQLLGAVTVARACTRPFAAGALSGVVSALLNLLVIGAFLVNPPAESGGAPAPGMSGLSSQAAMRAGGFVVTGLVIGLVGGWIGSRFPGRKRTDQREWLSSLAWIGVGAAAPLLLLGAVVTSTGSGMAVQGWPDSYGANMFLFPISLMDNPRVFAEHSHRLFGSLVGLTTLAITIAAFAIDPRGKVKAYGCLLFLVVCVQGYLGGGRVNMDSRWLGLVHGVLAQVFFAGMVAFAVVVGPTFREITPGQGAEKDARRRRVATALVHTTLLQLVFGAMYRHLGSMHPMWAHVGFAVIVLAQALVAGFLLRARVGPGRVGAVLPRLGTAIVAVVSVQVLLGGAALWPVLRDGPRTRPPLPSELATAPPIDESGAVIATLHHGNGALLLGLGVAAVVLLRKACRTAGPGVQGAVSKSQAG